MKNTEQKKTAPEELNDDALGNVSGGADAHAVTCRNCGEIIPGDRTFCPNCGTQMRIILQPLPFDYQNP